MTGMDTAENILKEKLTAYEQALEINAQEAQECFNRIEKLKETRAIFVSTIRNIKSAIDMLKGQ